MAAVAGLGLLVAGAARTEPPPPAGATGAAGNGAPTDAKPPKPDGSVSPGPVIPPGAEKRILAMLGGKSRLPGGCALDDARIDGKRVTATYRCARGALATLTLRYPTDGYGARDLRRTEHFILVAGDGATAALLDAVVTRVKAGEAGFEWITPKVEQGAPPTAARSDPKNDAKTDAKNDAKDEARERVAADLSPGARAAPPDQKPPGWDEAGWQAAEKLYDEGRYEEALAAYIRFVPPPPTPTPGHVVTRALAALASLSPDPARVAVLTADADAHPDDGLKQLIAGVGAHYCGHRHGRSREDKAGYYRIAIRYLERAMPRYDHEPRLFLYLAISHFRLGDEKVAQDLIERAVPLAANDPDVFYCRAEIFQNANLHRSIEDVRRYLTMTDETRRKGFPDNPEKHQRVEAMLAHLEAVERGQARPTDLWDPVSPSLHSPRHFGLLALAVAAVSGLLALGWRLLRRRRAA
jgi:tetratricopeptide (TPR) repeat protein